MKKYLRYNVKRRKLKYKWCKKYYNTFIELYDILCNITVIHGEWFTVIVHMRGKKIIILQTDEFVTNHCSMVNFQIYK